MENKKRDIQNYKKKINLKSMCKPTPIFFTPVSTRRFQTQTDNGDEYFYVIF
jgi:hypothetical protein